MGKRAVAAAIAVAAAMLSLAGLVVCVQPVFAVVVPWLYDVDVPVDGRTAAARTAVSSAALAEVLSRVSGLAHVPRNARVREALAGPEAYYNRFVFLNDSELRIHFVPAAILRLVDEARLPVWSSNRPQAIAWLVVERGGVREIVDGDHPLAETLTERARQRGLVVKLPIMDLEDRMHVQPSVIRGRLFSALERASRRYEADVILVGQVQEQACPVDPPPADDFAAEESAAAGSGAGEGLTLPAGRLPLPDAPLARLPLAGLESDRDPEVDDDADVDRSLELDAEPAAGADPDTSAVREMLQTAELEICGPGVHFRYVGSVEGWMDGAEFAAHFSTRDVQDAGRLTTDFFADELAGRFAVLARERNRLALTIRGIKSPVGYGQLLGYLDGLEFVTAVDIAAVQGDRLEIVLHTRAGFDQLVELFQNDGRIRPDPADETVLTWQGP